MWPGRGGGGCHLLYHLALSEIILSLVSFTDEEGTYLNQLLTKLGNTNTKREIEGDAVKKIRAQFSSQLDALNDNGSIAILWVQYIRMVTIVKQFIEADRSGNWDLHLHSIQQMLPYVHSN